MSTLLLAGWCLLAGTDGWVTWKGTWQAAGGTLRQTDLTTDGGYAWRTEAAYESCEISVRFRPGAAGDGVRAAGILFGWRDNLHGWYVHFDARHQQVILVRRTAAQEWHELDRHRGVTIALDTWHEGRVNVAGGRVAVWLDGALVAVGRDDGYAGGYCGVRAGQGAIEFEQFAVIGAPVALEPFQMLPDPSDLSLLPRLEAREDFLAVADGGGFFPVLVTLADGRLGAVVRGGAPHIGRAGRLDWISSADGGRTWSPPRVIVDSDWDDRNPAVGVMADGSVVCGYGEARSYNERGEFDRLAGPYVPKFCRSTDGGATWSPAQLIAPEALPDASPYGRILVLPDGTALMPVYSWRDVNGGTRYSSHLVRSTDHGQTWGELTLIQDGFNETSLERLPDGRLVAALRDGAGALSVCDSADGGRTWSPARPVTAPSLHPADLLGLGGETLLMVHGCRLSPKGVIARLSEDGGRTWPDALRAFIAWDADNTDCGYPSAQRLADGTVVVLWYAVGTARTPGAQARCVRFSEADLRAALAEGAR